MPNYFANIQQSKHLIIKLKSRMRPHLNKCIQYNYYTRTATEMLLN